MEKSLIYKSPMRYAHANGHTDVAYSSDGRNMLTCGSDGDVRIWGEIDDCDPLSTLVGKQTAWAIACFKNNFYVGSDNDSVNVYNFPGREKQGILSRFTAPVTHLSMSPDGQNLAAGSCDMEIQITNVSTYQSTLLSGHKGAILGVALDPKGKYLASSSCDGSVHVWLLETRKTVFTHATTLPPCNEFWAAKSLGRPSWQTISGRLLAIPTKGEVLLLKRDSWTKVIVFKDTNVSSSTYYSITSFSPCGRLLAACSMDGVISVWDVALGKHVLSEKNERKTALCALAWSPDVEKSKAGEAELAFCDNGGHLGVMRMKMPPEKNDDVQPNETSASRQVTFSEVDTIIPATIIPSKVNLNGETDDGNSEFSSPPSDDSSEENLPISKLQAAFQPTCTPKHLTHRIMVWNQIGIVTEINDDRRQQVFVQFHDSSTHYSFAENNELEHNMAALTKDVLLLTGDKPDSDTGSKVFCKMLNSWDTSKEWRTELNSDEEACALAAGDTFLVIATSKRNLRLLTLGGLQREVISVPGNIVCLASHQDKLLVVYHSAVGVSDDQVLAFMLLEVSATAVICLKSPQPFPLTRGSQLAWAGFSDEGRACSFDSSGILRMFGHDLWQVFCDASLLKIGQSSKVFLIGVSESTNKIRGILCKGTDYPQSVPCPTVVEFEMKMPLCEEGTTKSQLEASLLLLKNSVEAANILKQQDDGNAELCYQFDSNTRGFHTTLMKIFAVTSRQDMHVRSMEIYQWMKCDNVRNAARNYAAKYNKASLLERMEKADEYFAVSDKLEDHKESDQQDEAEKERPCSTNGGVIDVRPLQQSKLLGTTGLRHLANAEDTVGCQSAAANNNLLDTQNKKTAPMHKDARVGSGVQANPFKRTTEDSAVMLSPRMIPVPKNNEPTSSQVTTAKSPEGNSTHASTAKPKMFIPENNESPSIASSSDAESIQSVEILPKNSPELVNLVSSQSSTESSNNSSVAEHQAISIYLPDGEAKKNGESRSVEEDQSRAAPRKRTQQENNNNGKDTNKRSKTTNVLKDFSYKKK